MLRLALAPNRTPTPPPPTTITWNPMVQQFAEDDTTFLFDPALDTSSGIGINSGAPGALLYQVDAKAPTLTAGKFRTGVQPTFTTQGGVWMPLEGILGVQEFTVEFWVTLLADLASMVNQEPLMIGSSTPISNYCLFKLSGGNISVTLAHQQNPGVVGVYSVSATSGALAYTSGSKLSIAATLKSGTLTLFVGKDGVDTSINQVAQATGIVAPQVWATDNNQNGLVIGGGKEGSATQLVTDSVRISRVARTPGVSQPKPTGLNTITVSNTATGSTVQRLNGLLKPFTGGTTAPLAAAGIVQQAQRGLSMYRCGKFLSCSPIKTGIPDGTHPSAGHTQTGGVPNFSYDWQIVDRELRLAANTYGMEPYINFDSCPQILGGGVAPVSGTALTAGYAYATKWSNKIPNDLNLFAAMSADLVYHVLNELGVRINYWGPWNEPDGSAFWPQGPTAVSSYLTMYGLTANAVKAIDPTIKFGGPELGSYQNASTWILPLINYCATNSLPLEWLSHHYYSGNHGILANFPIQAASWCAAAGIPLPDLLIGEWGWPYYGSYPFSQPNGGSGNNIAPSPEPFTVDYEFDDWSAAFRIFDMILQQNNGYTISTVFHGRDVSLFDATGTQQAQYNSMLQWSKTLGNSVLSITGPGSSAVDPGLQALVSKDVGGKVYVLLANIHNRRIKTAYPVKLDLTAFGLANGTNIITYTVDDLTSNSFYGSGPGLASTGSSLSGGIVNLNVRARSTTLVVVG